VFALGQGGSCSRRGLLADFPDAARNRSGIGRQRRHPPRWRGAKGSDRCGDWHHGGMDIQVHPQFRHRLRELRQAAGLSLRELGKLVSYSHSYLWELEAGAKQPSAKVAARLDETLAAGGNLTTLVAARPVLPTLDGSITFDDGGLEFPPDWRQGIDAAAGLWRWTLLKRDQLRGAPFNAAAYLPPAVRWLTSALDDAPVGHGDRRVGLSDVDTIRQTTGTLRGLDNHYGGGHVHGTVVRYLNAEVTPLLRGRYDPATGRALFAAVAEMTQLAGWSAYDSGLHAVAQRYLIQALRLAMTAADRPLGAEILAAMSHQAAYLRDGAVAVDLARAAGRVAADAGVEAINAEAAVLEAHGHAIARDSPACATALDRAERTLDRADRTRDPQWIGYFDEAYLAAKFGHCFAALGRGDQAARFAARSLDMDSRYVRGRQFNLALLAVAHAQAGEVEEAARIGAQAARAAEGLESTRAVDYLARIADRLAPHVGLPGVDEFAEQSRAVLAQS
jgi:transcriptional regulator with XRE-family HTH domain